MRTFESVPHLAVQGAQQTYILSYKCRNWIHKSANWGYEFLLIQTVFSLIPPGLGADASVHFQGVVFIGLGVMQLVPVVIIANFWWGPYSLSWHWENMKFYLGPSSSC